MTTGCPDPVGTGCGSARREVRGSGDGDLHEVESSRTSLLDPTEVPLGIHGLLVGDPAPRTTEKKRQRLRVDAWQRGVGAGPEPRRVAGQFREPTDLAHLGESD